tara:strand:+ start:103798 stop:105156 length:1359 start_codon:yes stop_codon:yes gene_type:complete
MSEQERGELELPRKIILVDPSSVSRKLFAQNLELYTGAKVEFYSNADAVIDKLNRKDDEFNLIITVDAVGEEMTSLKIYYTVHSQKLNIPIILLGKNPKISKEVVEIEKEEWRKVVKEAARLMEVGAEQMVELQVPELYPFSLYSVLFDFKTPCKVWLKDELEVIEWKEKSETITKTEIRELLFKGNKSLYIAEFERLSFNEFISNRLIEMLSDTSLSETEKVNATGIAFDNTISSLSKVGLNEKSLGQSKEVISSMTSLATTTSGLDELLNMLQEQENSFLYKHSLMICAVAGSCIENLEWGTKDQLKTLCFAAFFHDITIPEDKLCIVHSEAELNDKDLSNEELDKVNRHALDASELIKTFSDVPFGVDQLILQHHGTLNGLGFAKTESLDNRLSPLAIIFIVVESLVHLILKNENETVKPEIFIKVIEPRFNKGKEKKVVEAIIKSFTS